MIGLKFKDEKSGYSIELDDDDKVAYLYLLNPENKIVSDVWLYNVSETPDKPEWDDKNKLPFLNPREYLTGEKIKPVENSFEARVKWYHDGNKLKRAELFLYDELAAVMAPNLKIGFCRFASKTGPLARSMDEFENLKKRKDAESKK